MQAARRRQPLLPERSSQEVPSRPNSRESLFNQQGFHHSYRQYFIWLALFSSLLVLALLVMYSASDSGFLVFRSFDSENTADHKMDMLHKLQATLSHSNALPASPDTCRVAVGFNSNLDLIVSALDFLKELDSLSFQSPPHPQDLSQVGSISNLVQLVRFSFLQGAAIERYVYFLSLPYYFAGVMIVAALYFVCVLPVWSHDCSLADRQPKKAYFNSSLLLPNHFRVKNTTSVGMLVCRGVRHHHSEHLTSRIQTQPHSHLTQTHAHTHTTTLSARRERSEPDDW